MALMTGLTAFMGFANESTWGTFASGVMYIQDLVAEHLKAHRPKEYDKFLSGCIHRLSPVAMPIWSDGDFAIKNSFAGCEYPLFHLLGSGATPNTATSGVGKWTFAPAVSLPTGLSISMNRPVGGTIGLFQYPGIKIKGGTFEFESGLPAKMTFDTIGGSPLTAAPPYVEKLAAIETGKTPVAYLPVLATYGEITIAGPSRKAYIQKATVKVDNKLADKLMAAAGVSITEPQRNEPMEIGGTLDVWMDATMHASMYTPWAAGTDVAIVLTYTGPLITGSSYYTFSISLPYCELGECGAPCCDNAGVTTVQYAFNSHAIAITDTPITITVWNTNQTPLS